MKANRKFTKDNEAVSPVIGVILMVAITVILAAVIAAFVFGMGGSLKKSYVVAATASQSGTDTVVITYQGGPDHSSISSIAWNVNGNESTKASPSVGYTTTITDATNITAGRDHVIITGTFADGSSQVILDTYV